MNTKAIYWFIISGLIWIGCIDDSTKMDGRILSDIMIESTKDTFLLEFGNEVRISPVVTQSIEGQEIKYEWRYQYKGKLEETEKDSLKILPCKEAILSDFQHFRRLGEYSVRLRASNEDGSSFHYFSVFIRSTYDKGLMVLSKDDHKKGRLSFLRVMNEEELLKNNLEPFRTNAFAEVNPNISLVNPTDMMFWKDKKVIIIAQENDGLHYCDQSLAYLYPLKWNNPFKLGKFYIGNSSSNKFLWTPEKGVFLVNEDAIYESKWAYMPINKACYCPFYSYGFKMDYMMLIDDEQNMIYCDNDKTYQIENKKFINMASSQTVSLVVLKDESEPNKITIKFLNTYDLRPTSTPDYTYEPTVMTLTRDAEILSEPGFSKSAFYSSGNKLYRWATSGTKPDLPTLPCLTVDGEITCLALSENWKYLYVGIYNPVSSEELKGSVWVMEIESLKIVKKFDNIADRPMRILYKENQ